MSNGMGHHIGSESRSLFCIVKSKPLTAKDAKEIRKVHEKRLESPIASVHHNISDLCCVNARAHVVGANDVRSLENNCRFRRDRAENTVLD